jgi:hypothetical protein
LYGSRYFQRNSGHSLSGDWGDVHPVNKKVNDDDLLRDTGPLCSEYKLSDETRIQVLTADGRSETCISLKTEH